MRHYPRVWNRFLIFVIGLILLVGGVAVALAEFWPRAGQLWFSYGPHWYQKVRELLARTGITVWNYTFSWITLVTAVVALIVAIIVLTTIFRQFGGKTREILNLTAAEISPSDGNAVEPVGSIAFTTKFMDEYVRDRLEDEPTITSVAVSSWRVKKDTALQLRIRVARGSSPLAVYAAVNRLSAELDRLLERPLPIMVRMIQGNVISQNFTESAPRVE